MRFSSPSYHCYCILLNYVTNVTGACNVSLHLAAKWILSSLIRTMGNIWTGLYALTGHQQLHWPREAAQWQDIMRCGLPRWLSGKDSTCQCKRHKRCGFDPWVRKIPWRRNWQPTPVLLPGNPRDRGAWWATAHGVEKSRMQLRD